MGDKAQDTPSPPTSGRILIIVAVITVIGPLCGPPAAAAITAIGNKYGTDKTPQPPPEARPDPTKVDTPTTEAPRPGGAPETNPIPVVQEQRDRQRPTVPTADRVNVKLCEDALQAETFRQQPDIIVDSGNIPSFRADIPEGVIIVLVGVHHEEEDRLAHYEIKLQNRTNRDVYVNQASLARHHAPIRIDDICANDIKFRPGQWTHILISYRAPRNGSHGDLKVDMGFIHG